MASCEGLDRAFQVCAKGMRPLSCRESILCDVAKREVTEFIWRTKYVEMSSLFDRLIVWLSTFAIRCLQLPCPSIHDLAPQV
jgi:hypothetical protein